jgi:hypothetical protein
VINKGALKNNLLCFSREEEFSALPSKNKVADAKLVKVVTFKKKAMHF